MIEPDSSGERTDPAWTVTVEDRPRLERVAESLCSLADGRFGTRGAREEDGAGSSPLTAAAGVYHDPGAGPTLLPGPVWTGLEIAPSCGGGTRQLDLRAGLLRRRWETTDGAVVRSLRFASLARPGVVGLRAEGPAGALGAGPALLVPGWWSGWPCTWPTPTAPRRPGRPWSGCARWRPSASTGCSASTVLPVGPGGPAPRSPSRATPTPSSPSGSPCSTCWPRPPTTVRRPSGPAA
jgi:hypothetical protein